MAFPNELKVLLPDGTTATANREEIQEAIKAANFILNGILFGRNKDIGGGRKK